MNKFSLTIAGILVAAAGSAFVSFGFTGSCSNEIIAKLLPLIGGIPGLGLAWIGRVRIGDVTPLGFRK